MADRTNIYEQVTNQIIAQLESGVAQTMGHTGRWDANEYFKPTPVSWSQRHLVVGDGRCQRP